MTETWLPPGPGTWDRDDTHAVGTVTEYLAALFVPAFMAGWKEAFPRYGLPLAGIDMAVVGGRLFARVRPVGAPEPKAGKPPPGPPPKVVFRLLCAVHPELRRRKRAATAAVNGRLWRDDRRLWRRELEPVFRRQCLALQAVDFGALDDAGLREHLAQLGRLFHDGTVAHFRQCPASAIPVGEFVYEVGSWTGAGVAESAAALQGSNPASAGTLVLLDEVAAAVRSSISARAALAEHDLTALRESSPAVAAAFGAYLAEHGNRIVTGFDLSDRTAIELPHLLLASIESRLDATPDRDLLGEADQVAAGLRRRVPAAHQGHFDELLDEARAGYALHDEDVGVTYTWPLGLIRRALLLAAERLVGRAALSEPTHVFEATPAEVAALLGGPGPGPSPTDLAARAAERVRLDQLDPPARLGPDVDPPDPALFPPAMARVTRAAMLYVVDANFARPATSNGSLDVLGVGGSPGIYEGRARVLTGPREFERLEIGDVLVAPVTSPAYNVVLPLLGAVVTDRGGALSHAAIVAREFGIPAVVGTVEATRRIPDGAKVRVDGTTGVVRVLG